MIYRMTVEFNVDGYDVDNAYKQAKKVADILNKHPGRNAKVSKAVKKYYTDEEMIWKKDK
jgi:hypothetical protein